MNERGAFQLHESTETALDLSCAFRVHPLAHDGTSRLREEMLKGQ